MAHLSHSSLVHVHGALRDTRLRCTPSCREAMQQEKRMLEQQLLETAGDMAHAGRGVSGSHVSSLSSNRSSSMEYSSGEEGSHHIAHLADMSAREVEALRAENETIMKVRLRHCHELQGPHWRGSTEQTAAWSGADLLCNCPSQHDDKQHCALRWAD